MALDSMQKRMSAMNHSCPWRGPLVDATEVGFDVGNRQAAVFMASSIASTVSGSGAGVVSLFKALICRMRR